MDILALLGCLLPLLHPTTLRQLSRIVGAMLACTGRVTMRGLARWGGAGTSYRTVQRFFNTCLPWPALHWRFCQHHHLHADEVYILGGDEVVVTKAGNKTHGRDRFYSGLRRQTVPGLAFFSLALIGTKARRAYPLRCEQVVRTAEEKAASAANTAAKKAQKLKPAAERRPLGRPKGSTNKPKTGERSPELGRIQAMLLAQLQLIAGQISVRYLALDGHFGNGPALAMVVECGLHLISKLRFDAALYQPYAGPYAGRGPRRKYGDKLDYNALPEQMLRERCVADGIESSTYAGQLRHKEFAQPLNVVIMVKKKLASGARSHVVLFSSDLELGWEQLVDYYSLRFQIEFTFRDGKQYWGLEDFMNVKAQGVANAANLALLMVSVSAVLLREQRQREPASSVLDLKAAYRGQRYVAETIKLLPQAPGEELISRIVRRVTSLGRIHPRDEYPDAA